MLFWLQEERGLLLWYMYEVGDVSLTKQILRHVTADQHDKVGLTLIYGNKGFSHILLKDEIIEQVHLNPLFKVIFVVGGDDDMVGFVRPLNDT